MSFSSGRSTNVVEVSSMKEYIAKATKTKQTPIKPKHIQNIVFLSRMDGGLENFWKCLTEHCLKTNCVSYWKYFQLFHTILLDNHPTALLESQLHFKAAISQQRLYWSPTDKSNYGKLLPLYCTLILTKLEFHYNNPNIPGAIKMSDEAFDLMIDTFRADYLARILLEILKYWSAIKDFLLELLVDMPVLKFKPYSPESGCKFQPFVLCIEESKQLYNYSRSILYKLHSDFPELDSRRANDIFMSLYDHQNSICTEAKSLDWLESCNDLDFIRNQNVPNVIRTKSVMFTDVPTDATSSTGQISTSSAQISNQRDPHSQLQKTIRENGVETILVNQIRKRKDTMPIQKSEISFQRPVRPLPLPPKPPSADYYTTDIAQTEIVSLLRAKVADMQKLYTQMSDEILTLTTVNTQLNAANKTLQSENLMLETEMKQLKITSGRQFCQLHAVIREKDALLKSRDLPDRIKH